jgi:hypothetical protein
MEQSAISQLVQLEGPTCIVVCTAGCPEQRGRISANPTDNLSAAWNAAGATMHARQQLLRNSIADTVVDAGDEANDVAPHSKHVL